MTDEKLVKRICVHMGWDEADYVFYGPFTDPRCWMRVVNYLVNEKEYFFRLYIAPNGVKVARFWYPTHDHTDKTFLAQNDSEGRAVIMAALKALGGEDGTTETIRHRDR